MVSKSDCILRCYDSGSFGDGAQSQKVAEEPGNYGGPRAQQQHPLGQMSQQMDTSQQQDQFPGANQVS
jgi:hypothetical protein